MNVTISNAPSRAKTIDSKIQLEQRLKEAINEKEITETIIKKQQHDLAQLIGGATITAKQHNKVRNATTSKMTETVESIDMEIAKLELERTINSMSLAAEREILKKIHKLNISRRQLLEKKMQEQQIKQQKATVFTLRDTLKEKRSDISELKVELATVQTAVALGCEVKDLLGKKIDCPTDKIGTILGKKGKNVQEIMTTNNVDVQVVKDQGSIHLIGTSLASLDTVVAKLEEAMTKVEKDVKISSSLHQYLNSTHISLLSTLRTRHPDTYIDMKSIRDKEENNEQEQEIRIVRIRGNPAAIVALETDLLNIECVRKDITVSSRTSGLLVGKSGKNIDAMVNAYQVAIEIERPTATKAVSVSKDDNRTDRDVESTKVKIYGPSANVEAALTVINDIVEENRDYEELVHLEAIVKAVLLQNSGIGIQALQKTVNEESKKNAEGTTSNSILINVKGNDLVVKGKTKAVNNIMPFVTKEIERFTSSIVRMNIDVLAIPVIIGKGGQGIKTLKEGTTSVNMEIHANRGEVEICGLYQNEIEKVVNATKTVIDINQVQRLRLEYDEISTTNSFAVQFRNLTRSAVMKHIKELVVLSVDNDSKEVALRGTSENLLLASKLVQEFLDTNFMEELIVSSEDVRALLTGGKTSKIVELAINHGVNLSVDKERDIVVAKGAKMDVVNAIRAVREFLYGSSDVAVLNIVLSDKSAMGVIIGKSGKSMTDLQTKFPSVSIIVHRTDASIALRGDSEQVEECHGDIMNRISSANITRIADLTKENISDTSFPKYIKRLGAIASVNVELDTEKMNVSFRGARSDVHAALTLLKEHLSGTYECQWYIGPIQFKKIYDVCNKSTHLTRMKQESGAAINLDEKFEVIVFSGTKETVKAAKKVILTFFDFVFSDSMNKFDVPAAAFSKMGKSAFINEIVAATSATLLADHDMSTILIFSTKKEKLDQVSTLLSEKLDAIEKLIFVWQFSESEEWLISLIIGKKGDNVQKLRKDTNCTIDVNIEERRMVVSADEIEIVTKGKEIIDSFVEKARKELAVIYLSSADVPAFIGKSGKNMKSFMDTHHVKVELVKRGDEGIVRITGSEEQVAFAKQGVAAWLANRIELRKDAEGELTKHIKIKEIPVIIGTKGETIRSVQREFGCKVTIDRDALTFTVSGGTSKKRIDVCEKFDHIILEYEEAKKTDKDVTPPVSDYLGDEMEFADEAISSIIEQMD